MLPPVSHGPVHIIDGRFKPQFTRFIFLGSSEYDAQPKIGFQRIHELLISKLHMTYIHLLRYLTIMKISNTLVDLDQTWRYSDIQTFLHLRTTSLIEVMVNLNVYDTHTDVSFMILLV